MLDDTHDPAVTSWVESANAPGADFPVQNLPFGWFRRRGDTPSAAEAAPPHPEIGVAIGDRILPLAACGSYPASMNELMAEPADAQRRRRLALHRLLRADAGPATRARLAAQLDKLVGVVDHGLFVGMAGRIVAANAQGKVRVIP